MPCTHVPPIWSAAPFAAILLAIAVLPLISPCRRFWRRNRNKLLLSLVLSLPVLLYYGLGHPGWAELGIAPGWPTLETVLHEALLETYIPFIVLLLALYTISGGVLVRGDLPAHPVTNTLFLAAGAAMASFVGTTGAAMLLIRPLLQTNSERKRVRHTVIFFIFLVCNTGGCLLPIGDPPLFLGYLKGVPFAWTLRLWPQWLAVNAALLAIYYLWDLRAYRSEAPADVARDESAVQPLRVRGLINLLWLAGVVLATATLVPGRTLAGGMIVVPPHLREAVLLALAGASMFTTPRGLRREHRFTFAPIVEVAALFLGIFITMQAPIEILRVSGPALGLSQPWQFFWTTGALSSFLDNAPTYAVFMQTADSLTHAAGPGVLTLAGGSFVRVDLLAAVSLGAVFMGANTYIGNGPNFMVKAIAEEQGVKMPGFFGYMLYSVAVLIPLMAAITLLSQLMGWG